MRSTWCAKFPDWVRRVYDDVELFGFLVFLGLVEARLLLFDPALFFEALLVLEVCLLLLHVGFLLLLCCHHCFPFFLLMNVFFMFIFLMLLFLVPWSGWLAWRWRKFKRLDASRQLVFK